MQDDFLLAAVSPAADADVTDLFFCEPLLSGLLPGLGQGLFVRALADVAYDAEDGLAHQTGRLRILSLHALLLFELLCILQCEGVF